MEHHIFGHACGQIGDSHPNDRYFRQAGIDHQSVDAGAQVENDAQIRKCRELPWSWLPDRGVADFGGVEPRIRQQNPAPVGACRLKSDLPSLRRPVFGPAMDEEGERSSIHWGVWGLRRVPCMASLSKVMP